MPTLSDRVSDVLGQATIASLIALVVAVLALWVDRGGLLARLDGVEQLLSETRTDLREFRKPGDRFTAMQGRRHQNQIDELRHDFQTFAAGGSRFTPLGVQIQAQIDECKTEMDESRNNWIKCIRIHENIMPRLDFLEKTIGD